MQDDTKRLEQVSGALFFVLGAWMLAFRFSYDFSRALTELMPLTAWGVMLVSAGVGQCWYARGKAYRRRKWFAAFGMLVWGFLESATWRKFGYQIPSVGSIGVWIWAEWVIYCEMTTAGSEGRVHETANA